MLAFDKNIISNFPFDNLKKISDLVSFEGPVLSHFIDSSDNNILYYWVDQNDKLNRWLVWFVSSTDILSYLSKEITLLELIKKANNSIYFLVDINDDIDVEKTVLLGFNDLPESYLPSNESYFLDNMPDMYRIMLDKWVDDGYISLLRDKAFYLKLEPSDKKYRGTFDLRDITHFLKSISESYINFVYFKSYNDLKTRISDQKKLSAIQRQLRQDSELRLVYLKTGSLEFGLAPDIVMNKDKYGELSSWRSTLIDSFKSEVINIDYSSDTVLKKLIEDFPNNQRSQIYNPFIKVITSDKYKVSTFEFKTKKLVPYKYKKEDLSELIQIPKEEILIEHRKKVFTAVIEATTEEDIVRLTKRSHQSNIIYQEEVDEFDIKITTISYNSHRIEFKSPLTLHIRSADGIYEFSLFGFGIINSNENLKMGQCEIDKILMDAILSNDPNDSLRNYLSSYVGTVDGKLFYSED